MKKFTKVVFITALFMLVILPLSAARTMSVTWNWVLGDPDIKEYRYQINKEDADGWTVVDGKTASYTADGLDAYSSYTLYLQASYDGVSWSVSASNTVNAPLTVEKEESVKVEETKTLPVEEKVVVLPVVLENDFSVYGYGVHNTYSGSTFTSATDPKIVYKEDILGFIDYEVKKYDYLLSAVIVDSLEDGKMVLTVPEGLDFDSYMVEYKKEIEEYIKSLTVVTTAALEEVKEEKVEKPQTEEVVIAEPVVEEKKEETPVVEKVEETPVTEKVQEEKPVVAPAVPSAPKAVEATPYEETEKSVVKRAESSVKPSFNLGLSLGAEWGFASRTEFTHPVYSYLPKAAITLEGENLLHVSSFGFGLRSDISAVILPSGLSYRNILAFGKYTYDLTADLKLMAYINAKPVTVYLGGGLGYTLLTGAEGITHSGAALGSFTSSFAITGVLGVGFHLGEKVDLRLEGYGRYFFPSFSSFKLEGLSLSPSLSFVFKF